MELFREFFFLTLWMVKCLMFSFNFFFRIGDQSNNFWDVGVHYNIVLTSGGQSRQTQSWVLKTAVVDQ